MSTYTDMSTMQVIKASLQVFFCIGVRYILVQNV